MKIIIYNSSHIENESCNKCNEFFKSIHNIDCNIINEKDLKYEILNKYDLLVIPGGKLLHLQHEIGSNGKYAILQFLQNGGKYIGICAGCFLATTKLNFMNETIRSPNFLHLFSSCDALEVNQKEVIKTDSGAEVLYWNGPKNIICNNSWEVLDTIDSKPCTIMKKNILLFSCHPELSNFNYFKIYVDLLFKK